jgi:hypothetical protein
MKTSCFVASILAIALIGATFFTMSFSNSDALERVLSPEKAKIYKKIAKERAYIYFTGLMIGVVLAIIAIYYSRPINMFHRVMMSLAIVIGSSVAYYSLMPKSDYMVRHLSSEKENRAWLEVYKGMKSRYMWGFVLGSAVAVPLAYSFC